MQQFDRQDRAVSILKELIASFIRNEANTTPLITVTNITLSSDSKRATVMVTTIPDSGEKDAVVWLMRHGSDIRDHIKKYGALRRIPHLEFSVDYGERHRQHIDELAKEIEK
jgi:ribosome-binding factor A